MIPPFEGLILLTGEVIYCKQGEHESAIPKLHSDFIKFTDYRGGLIVCEPDNFCTQEQLNSLWDICKKHNRLELYRRFDQSCLIKET